MSMLNRDMRLGWIDIKASLRQKLFNVQPKVMDAIIAAEGLHTKY